MHQSTSHFNWVKSKSTRFPAHLHRKPLKTLSSHTSHQLLSRSKRFMADKTQLSSNHYLIVGLGNIGAQYNNTRHNIGKDFVIRLGRVLQTSLDHNRHDCFYSSPIYPSKFPQEILDSIIYTSNLPKPIPNPKTQPPIRPSAAIQSRDECPIHSSQSSSTIPPTLTLTPMNIPISFPSTVSTSAHTENESPPPTQPTQTVKAKKKSPIQFVPITTFPSTITITLAYPNSFMNTSGKPIQRLLTNLHIPQQNLIVIHDDLDVKIGHVKLKNGGSSGGQNGLNDLLNILGHNSPFTRVRLGIGRPTNPNIDVPAFVLGKFAPSEREYLKFVDEFALTTISQTLLYGSTKANEHLQNIRKSFDAKQKPT